MRDFIERLRCSRGELLLTCAFFLVVGVGMNTFGKVAQIAEFRFWWQVLTCYLGYVVPLALFIRGWSFPLQYAVCVAAFTPLEIGGYALGTSIAHDGNIFEAIFGVRNFTAVMVMSVALIPPIGIRIVGLIRRATSA